MITKKTAEEIEVLAVAGAKLSNILKQLGNAATPGATALDLDDLAMELAAEQNVETVLLGYHPTFAPYPYPAAACI